MAADDESDWRFRTRLLLGREAVEDRLPGARVCVVGVGGVGGYCIEALARAGVGAMVLCDPDAVVTTNINRHVLATRATVGRLKVDLAKERVQAINPDAKVYCIPKRFGPTDDISFFTDAIHTADASSAAVKEPESAGVATGTTTAVKPTLIPTECCSSGKCANHGIDFLIDAIDSVESKLRLISLCFTHHIPIVSSMGMARRKDPTQVHLLPLVKTTYDPLAAVLRRRLRSGPLSKTKVLNTTIAVHSAEKVCAPVKVQRKRTTDDENSGDDNCDDSTVQQQQQQQQQQQAPSRPPLPSMSTVPAAAGLAAAYYVINALSANSSPEGSTAAQ
eukprot:TRINITY_DN257_c0_g1_i1.p1 TRINITY_DN257_c0_g1~~TRINITY_DN257_c0_g1_i1.p1  ORF type:complete len:342 (+),score=88.81 TRINITY_DN257_c0_g1_i1:29-1027(+)